MVCTVTRSKDMIEVTSPSKLEIGHFQKLFPQPFKMGAGNLPLIPKPGHTYLNLIGPDF